MRRGLALLALLTACAGVNTMKTPRPLDAGATQFHITPELSGGGPKQRSWMAGVPEVSIGAARGLGHGVDVGGKVSWLPLGDFLTLYGVEIGGKVHLYQRGPLHAAIAATAGYRDLSSSEAHFEAVYANAPLLLGYGVGAHELVFAPKLAWQRWYASGAHPVDLPSAGASLGFAWRVRWDLVFFPELTLMHSPTNTEGRAGGTTLFGLSFGMVFGDLD